MRIKLLCGLLILGLPHWTVAQNLIPNPGFEERNSCVERLGMLEEAIGWSNANEASPDLFNSCCTTKWESKGRTCASGIPKNNYGLSPAHSGSAYAGIFLWKTASGPTGNRDYREYLQIRLKEPLVKGKKYYLKMKLALAAQSTFAINQVQAVCSKTSFSQKADGILKISSKPILCISQKHEILKEEQWELVEGEYIASGGEVFIIIGNFLSNDQTKKTDVKTLSQWDTQNFSYYYIDDVSLSEMDSVFANEAYSTGVQFELPNLTFEIAKAEITNTTQLNLLADHMLAQPHLLLRITGQTDSSGSFEQNKILSLNRAQQIATYLINKGVAQERIETRGMEKEQQTQASKRSAEFLLFVR